MSFVDKILHSVSHDVKGSHVMRSGIKVGVRAVMVSDDDGLFTVRVFEGWKPPRVFRHVFATDLSDTIMKGVTQ